jgi:hypothetical protein
MSELYYKNKYKRYKNLYKQIKGGIFKCKKQDFNNNIDFSNFNQLGGIPKTSNPIPDDETIINELKKILKLSKYDKVPTNKYIKKKIAQNLDVVYEKIKDNKNLSNENIKSIMIRIDKEYEVNVLKAINHVLGEYSSNKLKKLTKPQIIKQIAEYLQVSANKIKSNNYINIKVDSLIKEKLQD